MLAPMSEYMTVEEVCGELVAGGVDEATVGKVFAARLDPQNLDDPDKKFVLGVPAPGSKAFLVVYRFGTGRRIIKNHPLDEGGPDLRPRWLSVNGPFEMSDAPAKAKELTS